MRNERDIIDEYLEIIDQITNRDTSIHQLIIKTVSLNNTMKTIDKISKAMCQIEDLSVEPALTHSIMTQLFELKIAIQANASGRSRLFNGHDRSGHSI